MAAAALERSINANLLRRWVVEAERAEGGILVPPRALSAPSESFVAVPMPPKAGDATPIRIEVRRGSLTVSVQWCGFRTMPTTDSEACRASVPGHVGPPFRSKPA
jgi:transposase